MSLKLKELKSNTNIDDFQSMKTEDLFVNPEKASLQEWLNEKKTIKKKSKTISVFLTGADCELYEKIVNFTNKSNKDIVVKALKLLAEELKIK